MSRSAPAAATASPTSARQVSTLITTSRVALADGGDEVDDPAQLLADVDVLAGPGLDPADVDDVGAVGDGPVDGGEGGVEAEGGAPVEERVGRAVDDGHDRVRAEVAPVQPQRRHVR